MNIKNQIEMTQSDVVIRCKPEPGENMNARERNIRAVEAFLSGLTKKDVDIMPFAPNVILATPLDPTHPAVGKEAVVRFLKTQLFPKITVRGAKVERHIVEGECVATLWEATFESSRDDKVVLPIFDFFRVEDGAITQIRPHFDPKALNQILNGDVQ